MGQTRHVSSRRAILLITLFSAPALFFHFYRILPTIIAGHLQEEYGFSGLQLGMFSAAFYYSYAALQIPAGSMVDLFGPQWILVGGLILAGAATLLTAIPWPAMTALLLWRVVAGIGLAVVFPSRTVMLAMLYPGRGFGLAFGVVQTLQNLTSLVWTTPLALFIALTSWRFANGVVAAVILVFAGLVLTLGAPPGPRPEQIRSGSGRSEGLGEMVRQSWVGVRKASSNPLLWPAFALIFGIYTPFLSFTGTWGAPFFRHEYGVDNTTAATYILFLSLSAAISPLVFGWVSDHLTSRRRLPTLWANAGLVLAWTYLFWSAGRVTVATAASVLVLIGFLSQVVGLAFSVVKEVSPPQTAGIAIGIANTFAFLGAAMVQPLFGWLTELSYRAAFGVSALFVLVAFLGAVRLTETYCRNVAPIGETTTVSASR